MVSAQFKCSRRGRAGKGSSSGQPSLQQLCQKAEEQSPRGPETIPGGQRVAGPHQGRNLRRCALPGDHDANSRRNLLLSVLAARRLDAAEESVAKNGLRLSRG
ncbi:hypothetical protein EPR50_G00031190 [Perca flavescens]|uniref:Uncharacterized protein n=1 Tax=Perca flavescens TaxID=8167 RepID=A0A484DKC0_PERFV|nr:hypothetical protein EPR50_G00031190 [Perca flavescens]